MVKKFTANVSEWFKKRLGSTASNIKMNGTQSAGTSENVAREDHVHPTDTSRAASSHTHGNITNAGAIGTAANKPIITTTSGKLAAGSFESTATNIKMNGTQAAGSLNTFARGDHVHPTDTSRASTAVATSSANGLMSSTDKDKLDKSLVVGQANAGGTTSAFTASITGVTLTHGTIIALYNAIGNNAASATLNVNSLGAKPIYYKASTITASTFPNKAVCLFMYNTSIVSTGCWQLIYSYDSNTTYTASTLKDPNAHSNAINTASNAYQTAINTALDEAIYDVNDRIDDIVAGDLDLTNYVKTNDSRLTDSRTPKSHAHGSLANGGTLNSDISSVNKIAVTDSSNNLKTISKLPADKVTHQDISGKLDTAGTGLSKSGTTLNHSNSVTAQTTSALKKIKYDAQGHITGTDAVAKSDITGLGIPAQDTTYSVATSSANGLMSKDDKGELDSLVNRYDGNYIGGVATVNKPYLRLFHLQSRNGNSSSGHLIFEIIGNNNDRQYAKIRVDLRQNTNETEGSFTVTPLEVYGINLNVLYFGFRDDYPNTCLDVFRKVGNYTNFYVRIYDDHLRDGSYTMFSPVVNGTESYTSLEEAANTLYNNVYSSTLVGDNYSVVNNFLPKTNLQANSFVKTGGTASQLLLANGGVKATSDFANSGHSHGDITNDGKIGTTANKPVITGTGGILTAGSFEDTATNIKMNGAQSVGSMNTFARGDHVHPTDTSRAPTSHAHGNLQNDGKVGTSDNASKNVVTDSNGKITTEAKPTIPSANTTATNIKMDGTQSAGSASTFAKADHVHPTDTSRASTDVASQSANGLMSSSDKTKLDGVATGANNYSHPNSGVTAGTNQSSNQTPAFNATFNIPKLTFDAQGHITASANSTVKIPALPTASTSQKGIIQIGTGSGNAAAGNHGHNYDASDITYSNDSAYQSVGIALDNKFDSRNFGTGADDVARGNHTHNYISNSNNAVTTNHISNGSVTSQKLQYFGLTGGTTSSGYVRVLQISIVKARPDGIIDFDVYMRQTRERVHCSLMFQRGNYTNPNIISFYMNSSQNKISDGDNEGSLNSDIEIYAVREATSTWSIVVKKMDSSQVDIHNITIPAYMMDKCTITSPNTMLSPLPSVGTDCVKATYIGYSVAEKDKLAGIAAQATKNVVSNSLTDTSTTNALSAAQGKALNDNKWTKTPTSLYSDSGVVDFNSLTTVGSYLIYSGNIDGTSHCPDSQGGLLIVHSTIKGVAQILINYYSTSPNIYYRISYNNAWRDWKRLYASKEPSITTYTSLQNNWSGTIKIAIKNGWALVTGIDVKCSTTSSGYVPLLSSNILVNQLNEKIYATGTPSSDYDSNIFRINSDGVLEGRCLVANQNSEFTIMVPVSND